ncbi:MAG TPA: tetratricopeptide repeat protein [Cyclobacteriaceae bacterium]
METEYFEKTPRKANRWFRAFVVLALLYGITFSLYSIFNWTFFLGAAYSLFMSFFTLPVQPKIFQKQSKPFNSGARASYSPPSFQPARNKKVVAITIAAVSFFAFILLLGIFSGNSDEASATNDSASDLTDAGMDSYRQEKYDEAEGYFDRALATDPSYMEAVYGKGISLYQKGNSEEANSYLTHAYEGGFQHAWLSWELADSYEKNGDPERAIALYKESIGLDSSYVDCYNRLAELLPEERDKYLELAAKHANN